MVEQSCTTMSTGQRMIGFNTHRRTLTVKTPPELRLFAPNEAQEINQSRRTATFGLGLLAATPLLPGCGGVSGDGDPYASNGLNANADAVGGANKKFRHPGLLVTEADFTRIRKHIKSGQQPWATWYATLRADRSAALNVKPSPREEVYRLDHLADRLYGDIWRAWSLALCWKLSDPQDNRYAEDAVATLDAWASTLKVVGTMPPDYPPARDDHTGVILAGIQGHQLAQIGEVMRTYSGWAPEKLKRFQKMLLDVFAPVSSAFLRDGRIGSHANWDMASLVGTMSIGIFCDRSDLYQLALDCYAGNNRGTLRNFGNGCIQHGVYFVHPGYMGQWEESGRDQGHSTLGMRLGGDLLEMAWNQGDDLYGMYDNRFLAAAEYVARSNLLDENGNTYPMPYTLEHNPSQPHTALWTEVNQSFQHGRNAWEAIYNHYTNRLGIPAPNVKRMMEKVEQNFGASSDDLWWATLTHRRPDYAGPMKAPSGLMVSANNGQAVLSWWGSVGAASYVVQRSDSANGPFTDLRKIATTGLLTYTDTPAAKVWYYRVASLASDGTRLASNAVRAVLGTEQRLSMPLNGRNNTGTAGLLVTSSGAQTGIKGTLINGAKWGEGRLAGDMAVLFDPHTAGSGLQLPAGIFADLHDFSLSMWAYANSLNWNTCMLFAGLDQYSSLYIAPKQGDGGKLRFGIYGATFNDTQDVAAPWPMPTRRWVHVAVTMRGSTVKLYVDGLEVGSSDGFRLSPRDVGDQVTFLGRNWSHDPFDGRIQDFRVWAGALGATEIAALAK